METQEVHLSFQYQRVTLLDKACKGWSYSFNQSNFVLRFAISFFSVISHQEQK
jgi:hypothetical protein